MKNNRGPGQESDIEAEPQERSGRGLPDSPAEAVNGMTQQVTTSTEQIDVQGGHLVDRVKELVHEGNVRRIIIKDSDGKTVMEVPVTVGVVGFLLAPTVAAIGALAALAADYSIEVERETPDSTDAGTTAPA
ncbi:DUF4342 domain-containing protein [Nocardia sp. NPDC004278]